MIKTTNARMKNIDSQNLKEICHAQRAGDTYVRILKPPLTTAERVAALRASAHEKMDQVLHLVKRVLTD
jgi:hypothetical protein